MNQTTPTIPAEWTIEPDGPFWRVRGPACDAVFKRREDAVRDIQRMIAVRERLIIHPVGR
jgi:hypothetical protein